MMQAFNLSKSCVLRHVNAMTFSCLSVNAKCRQKFGTCHAIRSYLVLRCLSCCNEVQLHVLYIDSLSLEGNLSAGHGGQVPASCVTGRCTSQTASNMPWGMKQTMLSTARIGSPTPVRKRRYNLVRCTGKHLALIHTYDMEFMHASSNMT